MQMASGDWAFFIDADERVSTDLGAEVRAATNALSPNVGYWVPRQNIIWGKWIKHGGWFPDYQLRLLHRGYARYDENREVHELVQLNGPSGYFNNLLIHHNYHSVEQFLKKQNVYTSLQAKTWHRANIRSKPQNYVLQPLREFIRRYFSLKGYRDGFHGLVLSILLAYYELLAYWQLRKLWAND
jgi:hypothetical protein